MSEPSTPDSGQSSSAPELLTFGEHPGSGNAPESFGDYGTRDLDLQRLIRFGCQAHAAISKAVFRNFIAIADHVEPRLTAHQLRQIEGDDAGVVRHEADEMSGPQFHERHRPARAFLNDLDAARRCGECEERRE